MLSRLSRKHGVSSPSVASEVQFLLPDFTVLGRGLGVVHLEGRPWERFRSKMVQDSRLVGPGLCKGSPEHPGRSPRQNWKHQRLGFARKPRQHELGKEDSNLSVSRLPSGFATGLFPASSLQRTRAWRTKLVEGAAAPASLVLCPA